MTVLPLLDRTFDLLRFRRALHHVALNAVAMRGGAPLALGVRYRAVREYVRRPGRTTAWPYGQVFEPMNRSVRDEAGVDLFIPEKGMEIARLRIFNMDFYVDLLNAGSLEAWGREEYGTAWQHVGPDFNPIKSPTYADVSPGRRFRLRIE